MTSLQLGLIAAGVLLVVAVLLYNWVQERRVRRRIKEAFSQRDGGAVASGAHAGGARVEPSFSPSPAVPENARRPDVDAEDDLGYEPPLDIQTRIASEVAGDEYAPPMPLQPLSDRLAAGDRQQPQPDPEIECIVNLQPVRPVAAGALAERSRQTSFSSLRTKSRRSERTGPAQQG